MAPPLADRRWLPVALFGLVALAWMPALQNGFVWDDINNLVRTDRLQQPGAIFEVFRHDAMWSAEADVAPVATYRPIALASFALDFKLFGDHAWGFHLSSVLWHLAAMAVVLALLRRWLGPGWGLVLTAVWALHPTAVEAVGWINGRSEVFALLFGGLAALAAPHGWRGAPGVAVGVLLGMLSKESALIFIPVALALAAEHEGRLATRPPWRWISPPAAVGAAMGLLAYGLIRSAVLGGAAPGFSFSGWLAALPAVWGHAAHTALLPLDSGITILQGWLEGASLAEWVGFWFLLAALFVGAVLAWRRGERLVAIGLGWWWGGLLPAATLVPMGWPGFQRWLYLALPGLLLAVGAAARHRRPGRLLWAIYLIFLAFLVVRMQTTVQVWRDDGPLFRATAEEQPEMAFGYAGMGVWLLRMNEPKDAEAALRQALAAKRPPAGMRLMLASAIARQDRCAEAVEWAAQDANHLSSTVALALGECFQRASEPAKAAIFFKICAPTIPTCAEAMRSE